MFYGPICEQCHWTCSCPRGTFWRRLRWPDFRRSAPPTWTRLRWESFRWTGLATSAPNLIRSLLDRRLAGAVSRCTHDHRDKLVIDSKETVEKRGVLDHGEFIGKIYDTDLFLKNLSEKSTHPPKNANRFFVRFRTIVLGCPSVKSFFFMIFT